MVVGLVVLLLTASSAFAGDGCQKQNAKTETNRGDLWLQERCILQLVTLHGACTSMVWDGTGEFADATGWLAHAPPSQSEAFPDKTQLARGEICVADD